MSKRNRDRRESNRQRRLSELKRPVAAVPGDGSVHALAREACSVVLRLRGRSALVAELEAQGTSDEDIATAYASGYRAEFRQEAFDGAMAALLASEPNAGDAAPDGVW